MIERPGPPIELRPFEPGDMQGLVDAWFLGWKSVGLEVPKVSRSDLAERAPGELASRWRVVIADVGGRVAGFVAVCLEERRLDQLFIHPDFQGQGVGSALFEVARTLLDDDYWLSTQPGNLRACRFYERRGLVADLDDNRDSDVVRFRPSPQAPAKF